MREAKQKKRTCPGCKGRGQVPDSQWRDAAYIPCPMCRGDGECYANASAAGWADVSIVRTVSNRVDDSISIDISTPTMMLNLNLSLADFTLAITGRGGLKAWFEQTDRTTKGA